MTWDWCQLTSDRGIFDEYDVYHGIVLRPFLGTMHVAAEVDVQVPISKLDEAGETIEGADGQ